MTDRQIQAVAEAIAKTLFTTHGFDSSQPMTEVAQAAIEAPDAKYVPMLVEVLWRIVDNVPLTLGVAQIITEEALAQLPKDLRQ